MVELRKKTEGASTPAPTCASMSSASSCSSSKETAAPRRQGSTAPAEGEPSKTKPQGKGQRERRKRAQSVAGPLADRHVVSLFRRHHGLFDRRPGDRPGRQGRGRPASAHAAVRRRVRRGPGAGSREERRGETALRAVRQPAQCLSPVQPVHRQGRPAGPSRRASDLPRRQARPELSAPAGRPDDARGRDARPRPRARARAAPAFAMKVSRAAGELVETSPIDGQERTPHATCRPFAPVRFSRSWSCVAASPAAVAQRFFRPDAGRSARAGGDRRVPDQRVGRAGARARGRPGRSISPAACTRGSTSPGPGSSATWAKTGSRS